MWWWWRRRGVVCRSLRHRWPLCPVPPQTCRSGPAFLWLAPSLMRPPAATAMPGTGTGLRSLPPLQWGPRDTGHGPSIMQATPPLLLPQPPPLPACSRGQGQLGAGNLRRQCPEVRVWAWVAATALGQATTATAAVRVARGPGPATARRPRCCQPPSTGAGTWAPVAGWAGSMGGRVDSDVSGVECAWWCRVCASGCCGSRCWVWAALRAEVVAPALRVCVGGQPFKLPPAPELCLCVCGALQAYWCADLEPSRGGRGRTGLWKRGAPARGPRHPLQGVAHLH